MKIYFGESVYPVIWKTKMAKGHWYNMEPVKIKITMPSSDYYEIVKSLNKKKNAYGEPTISFNIHNDVDKLDNSSIKEVGLWEIKGILESTTISSKFRDGTIIAIFDFRVIGSKLHDKSVLRNLLLSELV